MAMSPAERSRRHRAKVKELLAPFDDWCEEPDGVRLKVGGATQITRIVVSRTVGGEVVLVVRKGLGDEAFMRVPLPRAAAAALREKLARATEGSSDG